jgi:tryptophan 2,3-dioxygenase
MNISENAEAILNEIEKKICIHRSKKETHLEGLLWSKPMTYWDYIQTDALLNIQTQGQHFQMKWFYHVSSSE